jgi:hypothetical protein
MKVSDPVKQRQLGTKNVNKHCLEAGDALGTVFYMIAAKQPQHKNSMKIIESFRGTYGVGSYKDLPLGQHLVDVDHSGNSIRVNPREIYVNMVKEGRLLAGNMDMTLMEYMKQEVGSNAAPVQYANAPTNKSPGRPNSPNNPNDPNKPPVNPPNNPNDPNKPPVNPPNNPNDPNKPPVNPPNNPNDPNKPPVNPPNNPNDPNKPPVNPPNNPNDPNKPPVNPPNNPDI